MRNLNLLTVYLLLFLFFSISSCSRILKIEPEIFSNIELKSNIHYNGIANKKTLEGLLAELWNSGFFQNSEPIREEIFNNNYGLFSKGSLSSPSSLKKGRAYYLKIKGQKDKVMLNKKLFSHYVPSFGGKLKLKPLNKKIKATIIHELFHDFWYNILDKRERFMFSIESEIFCLEAFMAKTNEDKIAYLRNIGMNNPCLEDFKPYEELKAQKEYYADQKFFGTELYSILAYKAFSGKMTIPKQLRRFYYGIVSESFLNRDRK